MIGEIIGQEISVNVPKNMKAQVIPQGNSKQETTKGLQILEDTNEGTEGWNMSIQNGAFEMSKYTNLSDGIEACKFKCTESSSGYKVFYRDCNTEKLKNNTKYTLQLDVLSNKNFYLFVVIQTVAGQNRLINFVGKSYTTPGKWQTFKMVAESNDVAIVSSQILYLSVDTINTANDYFTIKNLILVEGDYSEQDLEWEKYTGLEPMPSLNYLSEVEAVGDNINFFNKETATEDYYVNSSGELINYTTNKYYASDYMEVLPEEDYTYSGNSTIQTGFSAKGAFYDSNKSFLNYFNINNVATTITTPENCKYIRMSVSGNDIDTFKLERGPAATPYSPYGQGNIEIIHNNKNELILNDNNSQRDGLNFSIKDGVITISGTATSTYQGLYIPVKRTFNEDYVLSTNAVGSKTGLHIKAAYKLENGNLQYPDIVTRFVFPTNSYLEQLYVIVDSGSTIDATIKLQLEKGTEVSDFTVGKLNKYILPIQKPFYMLHFDGDVNISQKATVRDSFILKDGKWCEKHNIAKVNLEDINWYKGSAEAGTENTYKRWNSIAKYKDDKCGIAGSSNRLAISNYLANQYYKIFNVDKIGFNIESSEICIRFPISTANSPEEIKNFWQEKANEGNGAYILYPSKEPELIECTEEQAQVLEQLSNLYLYEGINYLYSTDDLSPIFQFSYNKIVNDFKFYLSENGRLIFPNENISFLCSISESSIPSMPEALETSATIAGRDGDVPLSTTYGPMSFELVLYTEDNLTPEEKLKQEIFLNRFCNSIKNNTETFALELAQKFYKIKYNGLLNKENYPKFLKFTLPFKSSKSFAYDVKKNTAYGNNTFESNTIEPTGFECVIKGPAIKPIISLNDYSIEYNNTILDDESLIIDTNNSTAVLVNSEGTRVNAMRYYNHQFPKILNGENELKILSGIDNPENVSISWYDLTL